MRNYQIKEKLSDLFGRSKFRSFFYIGGPRDHSQRLLGMGPEHTAPNSEIWMLKGGRALYMLSPIPLLSESELEIQDLTGTPSGVKNVKPPFTLYYYMGECFVAGLMKGELLDFMQMDAKARPAPLEDMDDDFRTIYIA